MPAIVIRAGSMQYLPMAQGKERIGRQIVELGEKSGKLENELTGVKKQIEARIQELTRAKAERVRESIEKSIVGPGRSAEGHRGAAGSCWPIYRGA